MPIKVWAHCCASNNILNKVFQEAFILLFVHSVSKQIKKLLWLLVLEKSKARKAVLRTTWLRRWGQSSLKEPVFIMRLWHAFRRVDRSNPGSTVNPDLGPSYFGFRKTASYLIWRICFLFSETKFWWLPLSLVQLLIFKPWSSLSDIFCLVINLFS